MHDLWLPRSLWAALVLMCGCALFSCGKSEAPSPAPQPTTAAAVTDARAKLRALVDQCLAHWPVEWRDGLVEAAWAPVDKAMANGAHSGAAPDYLVDTAEPFLKILADVGPDDVEHYEWAKAHVSWASGRYMASGPPTPEALAALDGQIDALAREASLWMAKTQPAASQEVYEKELERFRQDLKSRRGSALDATLLYPLDAKLKPLVHMKWLARLGLLSPESLITRYKARAVNPDTVPEEEVRQTEEGQALVWRIGLAMLHPAQLQTLAEQDGTYSVAYRLFDMAEAAMAKRQKSREHEAYLEEVAGRTSRSSLMMYELAHVAMDALSGYPAFFKAIAKLDTAAVENPDVQSLLYFDLWNTKTDTSNVEIREGVLKGVIVQTDSVRRLDFIGLQPYWDVHAPFYTPLGIAIIDQGTEIRYFQPNNMRSDPLHIYVIKCPEPGTGYQHKPCWALQSPLHLNSLIEDRFLYALGRPSDDPSQEPDSRWVWPEPLPRFYTARLAWAEVQRTENGGEAVLHGDKEDARLAELSWSQPAYDGAGRLFYQQMEMLVTQKALVAPPVFQDDSSPMGPPRRFVWEWRLDGEGPHARAVLASCVIHSDEKELVRYTLRKDGPALPVEVFDKALLTDPMAALPEPPDSDMMALYSIEREYRRIFNKALTNHQTKLEPGDPMEPAAYALMERIRAFSEHADATHDANMGHAASRLRLFGLKLWGQSDAANAAQRDYVLRSIEVQDDRSAVFRLSAVMGSYLTDYPDPEEFEYYHELLVDTLAKSNLSVDYIYSQASNLWIGKVYGKILAYNRVLLQKTADPEWTMNALIGVVGSAARLACDMRDKYQFPPEVYEKYIRMAEDAAATLASPEAGFQIEEARMKKVREAIEAFRNPPSLIADQEKAE